MDIVRYCIRVVVLWGICAVSAAAQAQDEVVYYHSDSVGSVRVVTDVNGNEVTRFDYLPFGERWPSSPTGTEPRQFTGAERDPGTGFDYLGSRYLSANVGRFTSPDDPRFGDRTNPQSWSLYVYANNNPLRYVDPSGHLGECPPGYPKNMFCSGVQLPPVQPPAAPPDRGLEEFLWNSWLNGLSQSWVWFAPRARGFADGVTDTLKAPFDPSGPPSCLLLFARETLTNLSPIPMSSEMSPGDLIPAVGDTAAIVTWNSSLRYAGARPNYLGFRGLIYPNKSSVYRRLLLRSERVAKGSLVVQESFAMGAALLSEYDAASTGGCR